MVFMNIIWDNRSDEVSMNIKAYVKDNILLMDGAMGTYYAELTGGSYTLSEPANLSHPEIILRIHKEYVDAGAKLIRTNTFSANPYTLYRSLGETRKILMTGIDLANKAVKGTDCAVAYSIGPIPEPFDVETYEIMDAYRLMLDVGLDKGVEIIYLETFSRLDTVAELVRYIRSRNTEVQIITSYSLNQYGYTKVGVPRDKVIEQSRQNDALAAYGFNCGVGVSHLLGLIKTMDFDPMTMVAVPNAGYPDQQMERAVYQNNGDFFADTMMQICEEGVRIIGGCCGTTPDHIRKIRERLASFDRSMVKREPTKASTNAVREALSNPFRDKLEKGKFVYAVELDPPYNMNIDRMMSAAYHLQDLGVDVITIADSPLGRARADALLMAAKIKQSLNMEVLPHVSLRDKNLIALRSALLGAHISNIRNLLVVTGDPIPSDDRDEIKSVFNMNAIKFMAYVSELNETLGEDTFFLGGALNPYPKNIETTIDRVKRKMASGAQYLLTQPVYNQEGINNIRQIKEATGIKILGGIMPLVSLRNARFLHFEFPGITIPESVMSRFKEDMTREENESVGVSIATDLAKELMPHVDGLYFMTPFNRAEMIGKVIRNIP